MQARRKIVVAGATGTVGRHVVDVLEAEGHDVVGMLRSLGVVRGVARLHVSRCRSS